MEEQVGSESEWEYEYDAEQTEAVYLTIDLTTHVAPSLSTKRKAKSNKSPSLAKKYKDVQKQSQAFIQNDQSGGSEESSTLQRLQIVDLAGPNPLVSYNGQLYSCYWATDIGTSVYLAAPDENADHHHTPLRSFRSFDLLGTSSARLVAVPVVATERTPAPHNTSSQPEQVRAPVPEEDPIETDSGDKIWPATSQPLRIETPANASWEKVSQARFLERLSAIKLRRGETDAVPVKKIAQYDQPKNWREVRAQSLAKERGQPEVQDGEGDAEPQSIQSLHWLDNEKQKGKRKPGRPPGRPRKIRLQEDKDKDNKQRAVPVDEDNIAREDDDNDNELEELDDAETLTSATTPASAVSISDNTESDDGDEDEDEEVPLGPDDDNDEDYEEVDAGEDEEEAVQADRELVGVEEQDVENEGGEAEDDKDSHEDEESEEGNHESVEDEAEIQADTAAADGSDWDDD